MAGSASESSEMWNRVPLIVILGPTGVGKSKLSLELAKRFSGEIISADSMQVYKGLDVITNKVTDEERAVAPHHLLDFLDPLKKYTVVHFRNRALPIVQEDFITLHPQYQEGLFYNLSNVRKQIVQKATENFPSRRTGATQANAWVHNDSYNQAVESRDKIKQCEVALLLLPTP